MHFEEHHPFIHTDWLTEWGGSFLQTIMVVPFFSNKSPRAAYIDIHVSLSIFNLCPKSSSALFPAHVSKLSQCLHQRSVPRLVQTPISWMLFGSIASEHILWRSQWIGFHELELKGDNDFNRNLLNICSFEDSIRMRENVLNSTFAAHLKKSHITYGGVCLLTTCGIMQLHIVKKGLFLQL